MFRNHLYPQSASVGHRVDRWMLGGVFAELSVDGDLMPRVRPR